MQGPFHYRPELVSPSVWIAPGAIVVGEVSLADEVNIWFQAVLRGDVEPIRVGARSNIQDGSVLHADPGFPCDLAEDVTVGHRAVVHGATVERGALIGMGAVLLNGCVIGEESLIGAAALVRQGMIVPPRTLVLGVPARVVRDLTDEELAHLRESAPRYVERARFYRDHPVRLPNPQERV